MNITKAFTLLLPALLALSACGPAPRHTAKDIQVETMHLSHTVTFPKSRTALANEERAALDDFLAQVAPSATRGIVIEANAKHGITLSRAANIRSYLVRQGYPHRSIEQRTVNAMLPSEVTVTMHYSVAIPPQDCPAWSTRAVPNYSNEIHSNYGCATYTNLARQVADPADLVRGSGNASPDNDRSQAIIGQYKLNTVPENETTNSVSNQ